MLYAVAALLLGMAHRMPLVAKADPAIAVLLAEGKLLPPGCGSDPEDPGQAVHGLPWCDACLLAQGAAPPPPAAAITPPAAHQLLRLLAADHRAQPPAPRRTRPPGRAPPLLA